MSSSDLENIIPKSNADTSDETDEYEVVTDTSEEDVKPTKSKKCKKNKKHASPVRTKKTKLPSRGAAVGSDQLPPLQTTNPAQHALEAPKPMLVKQAIDNQFDKTYQIDLSKETQQGIAYQHSQQVPQQVEEHFEGPFYKHKYFPLIVVIIVSIACIAGAWWYFRHKFRTGYDPIKATLTGGGGDESDSSDSSDDEDKTNKKSLNELTGSAGSNKLPPSYEDSFDQNDDSDGEKVIKDLKSVPKSGKKSAPKKESKSSSKSAKGPQRDSHGRFIKK